MPNWCNNYLRVDGPVEDVTRFREEVKSKDSEGNETCLSFEKHVPMEGPDEDWYNEHCDKWGTKWDACEPEIINDEPEKGYLSYSFQTAWAPPCPWLMKVVELFPTLNFEMDYEEPGCVIYGVSTGSEGKFSDREMSHAEYLMEYNEEYTELVKKVRKMTQEELIASFAGINNFGDCCVEDEDWPNEEWNDYEMFDFGCLSEEIVNLIEVKNLPLFMNVNWGSDYANDLFKERIKKGV